MEKYRLKEKLIQLKKERLHMPKKRYVTGGSDGWLRVKRDPTGEIISIPEHLQIDLTTSSGGRDYFTITKGVHRNKKFSVISGNISSQRPEYKSSANLTFSLSRKTLNYRFGSVKAFTWPENPIEIGVHPIQIPDHPHDGGIRYSSITPYAKTWFYLGRGEAIAFQDDRYLHPGRESAGCITVEPAAWNQLYRYLILCRTGDGKTVGNVAVVR
ncbi:hypothetical protein [Delftia sp. ZNC0008]|nr:hypothetical protein [Delftia sp. ZNC0008]